MKKRNPVGRLLTVTIAIVLAGARILAVNPAWAEEPDPTASATATQAADNNKADQNDDSSSDQAPTDKKPASPEPASPTQSSSPSPKPSATRTSRPKPTPTPSSSTAKPVSAYFSYEKQCSVKPPQLYIHLTDDSPELEVRYKGVEQLQAGDEYWIDYPGGVMIVTVNVRGDESNSVTIVMECSKPSPTPTVTPTSTPSVTPTQEPTPTVSPTVEPSPSPTPTQPTHEPTSTPSPTVTPTVKPTPTPSETPTPTVTPTTSPSPTPTPPVPPTAKKVTLKVQVDKYSTSTKKLRAKAAGYDNDRLLKKGEDRPHYGKSTWEIVTVTGTTETTKAQWLSKINKATKKVPNLKSGKKWTVVAIKAAKAKSITVAWVISGDGKPTAWHAGHTRTNVAQRFFASNR